MVQMRVTPASRLLHQPVQNHQGLPLGEIEELVIDLDRGFIAYVVLVPPVQTGLAGKRFAIPWSAFSFDAGQRRLRLNLQPEVLRDAEGLVQDAASPALPSPSAAPA